MTRLRRSARFTGAIALAALLLLLPGFLRGHAHAARDGQPECTTCLLANHAQVVQPAPAATPAPAIDSVCVTDDLPVASDAPVTARVTARGPPAPLRTIA